MQIIKITKRIKKKNRSVLLSTDKREAEQQTRKAGRGEGHLLPELGVSAPHPPTPPPPPHHPPPPGSAVLAAGGRGGTAVKAARRSRSRSLPPPRTRPSLRSIPALRALRSDLASPYPAAWPAPSQVGLLVTLLLFIYIYIYIYMEVFGLLVVFFSPSPVLFWMHCSPPLSTHPLVRGSGCSLDFNSDPPVINVPIYAMAAAMLHHPTALLANSWLFLQCDAAFFLFPLLNVHGV